MNNPITKTKEIQVFQILEESLWIEKTRFSKDYMEKVLDSDFFEFGRSGKTYTRTECIDTEPQKIIIKLPLENFTVHVIDENIRLITYISEVDDAPIQRANRSSLWVRRNNEWKLRFHQGTPI